MTKKELESIRDKHFGAFPVANIELKDLMVKQDIHQKLSSCIIEMITSYNLPYYGEFCQFINFWEAKIGTAGVNVSSAGMNFYWDRKWIDKITRKQTIFTIVHEVFHLLFDHQKRGVGYDHKVANLSADMIINSIIHGDLIVGEGLGNMIEIPKNEDGKNTVVFLPKEYNGPAIFEDVYAWLLKKYEKWRNKNSHRLQQGPKKVTFDKDGNPTIGEQKYCKDCGQKMKNDDNKKDGENGSDQSEQNGQGQSCPNCGQPIPQKGGQEGGQGQGNGQGQNNDGQGQNNDGQGQNNDGQGQPYEGEYGPNGKSGVDGNGDGNDVDMFPIEHFFENIEANKGQSFDIHFDDDVPEAARKQFVESTMDKLKSRGLQSANIEKILNKLRKSEKDYLKEIKRNLSNDIFGNKKRKSITKPNRKGIWGLKGTRKYKTKINCILDTSGSMNGEFERVLSYIFQNDIEINLIQIDADIQQVINIKRKSELETMAIKGLGGTTLTPGLQYIANDKKLNKLNTVILTDGFTDSLDLTGVKGNVLVLSTSQECPVVQNSAKLRQIIIDKDKH